MRRSSPALNCWLRWLILAAGPIAWLPAGLEGGDIVVNGGDHYRALTVTDLASGAGSNFVSTISIGTTFTLTVSSNGACEVRVRRSSAGWLTAGNLVVQVKTGESFGPAIPVDVSDHLLISSPSPLTNQIFELRYSLQNVTVENTPGSFSAQITYTVTEI